MSYPLDCHAPICSRIGSSNGNGDNIVRAVNFMNMEPVAEKGFAVFEISKLNRTKVSGAY